VVLDQTSFYAEAGGQIYDTGVLLGAGDMPVLEIQNVQCFAGYVLHIGRLCGPLRVGDHLTLQVDVVRRAPIMSNHTSTHVLNFALRSVLGDGVDQRGSLVDPEKLRFDFSHGRPLTLSEVEATERLCSSLIDQALPVYRAAVALALARSIRGVRAVFGETYPDPVTVVSIGRPISELIADPDNPEWYRYSIEFCGGTHLGNTKEAGSFLIASEHGIAKGIRRIVAWTGEAARKASDLGEELAARIQEQARVCRASGSALEQLQREVSALGVTIESAAISLTKRAALLASLEKLSAELAALRKDVAGTAVSHAELVAQKGLECGRRVFVEVFEVGADRRALSQAVLAIREKVPDSAVMGFSRDSSQLFVVANVSKSLSSAISAAEWAKEIAVLCKGKGGGKPEAAQASGSDLGKWDDALILASEYALQKLKIQ